MMSGRSMLKVMLLAVLAVAVQAKQLPAAARSGTRALLVPKEQPSTLLSLLSRSVQKPEAETAANAAPAEPAAAAAAASSAVADSAASQTYSWTVVYGLCALMLLAISPILVQHGPIPFFNVIVYLTNLTLVKMYMKIALQNGMPYPYSITALHMFVTMAVAAAFDRPQLAEALQVMPISLVNGVSLALNNTALCFGGVAFVTMLSCCTPASTCAVETLSGRKQLAWQAALSVAIVVAGGMLCVKGETEFSILATFLALGACVGRSLKSVWQGDLLKVQLPPFRLVAWSSFWSMLMMLPVAAYFEGAGAITSFGSASGKGQSAVFLSALTAMVLNMVQCFAVKQLGPLMQSVLGNLQLILVIVLASAWLQESVSMIQWAGVLLLAVGAGLTKGKPAAPAKDAKRSKGHAAEQNIEEAKCIKS